MQPVIFTVPWINMAVPGYGLMLMLAFLGSIAWAARRAAKSGANPDVILNCGFVALVAGILGARIMFVARRWDAFAAAGGPLDIAFAILNVTRGGLEYYGGFIGATVCVVLYLVLWKHSLRWYMDIIAPSAAMGLAIGRLGCFLNGCCWGGVCDLPWAVSFPYGSSPMVEQWRDGLPGMALRQELIYRDDRGILAPLSREAIEADDAELAAAQRAHSAAARLRGVRSLLGHATDANERAELQRKAAQLEAELAEARKEFGQRHSAVGCGHAPAEHQHVDVLRQMERYGVTAGQLRSWAERQRSLRVHPTQLYSTVAAGVLALLLAAVYWRRRRDGQVLCLLLVLEPPARFLIEDLRVDNPVDTLWVLTISQGIALGLTVVGLLGLVALRRLPPRSPRAKVWVEPEAQGTRGRA
jgi:phosphatidylglycerol:prolipoprotein diacylglycerol transferase